LKVLISFRHGLGDACQLTAVLRHLRHYHPDWTIDVCAGQGKHSAFYGLANRVYVSEAGEPKANGYDKIFNLDWYESDLTNTHTPSTKVEKCLRDVFHLEPIPELCGYQIKIRDGARLAAEKYFESIKAIRDDRGLFNVQILHYEGNTSSGQKNLNHDLAKLACELAIQRGLIPVILDWDFRSPLPDGKRIFCPDKNHSLWMGFSVGDAERIAALIDLASSCISIDSGPGHIAAATSTPTPTLLIWRKHHPIRYCAPSFNVTHLVPDNHSGMINHAGALDYFRTAYRHRTYSDLGKTLLEELGGGMPAEDGLRKVGDFWIRENNIEQDMVIVRDVVDGDCYKTAIIPGVFTDAKLIIDVGSHIGCFAKLAHKLAPKAKIVCVEVCPENLAALRKNVGEFATVIHGACTYEPGDLMLLNAVRPNCESTGGSVVVQAEQLESTDLRQHGYKYWADRRPLAKVTLESILELVGMDRIDVLKLDCEGSEFSILKSPSMDKIRYIVGEYHGRDKWNDFRVKALPGWDYGHMHDGGDQFGLFHYRNPNWEPAKSDRFYGQHNPPEDKIIEELLPAGFVGTAVDVGAGDGIDGSNTLRFEKRGWKVLCIEANPAFASSLSQRKLVRCPLAISGYSSPAETLTVCTTGGREGAVTSLWVDQRLKEHFIASGQWEGSREVAVPVSTLTQTLGEAGLSTVDVLSIDTEGTELDVLKGLDWSRFRPRVIVVENNWDESHCREFLKSHGYRLERRNAVNDFFVQAARISQVAFLYPGEEPHDALNGFAQIVAENSPEFDVRIIRSPSEARESDVVFLLTEVSQYPLPRIDADIAELTKRQIRFAVIHNCGSPTPGKYPSFAWTQTGMKMMAAHQLQLVRMPVLPARVPLRTDIPFRVATFGHVEAKKKTLEMAARCREIGVPFEVFGPDTYAGQYSRYIESVRSGGTPVTVYPWRRDLLSLADYFKDVSHFLFVLPESKSNTAGSPTSPRWATAFGRPVIVIDDEPTFEQDGFTVLNSLEELTLDVLRDATLPNYEWTPAKYLEELTVRTKLFWGGIQCGS